MSVNSGPMLNENGLVFYYDMGNIQKSWKGKPTTNVISTNLSTYTAENGCTVTLLSDKLNGNPVYRVVFPSGTLPRIYTTFAYTAGQQYNGSIYYKVVSQGSHTPLLYFRESGFGTSYVSSVGLTNTSWTPVSINYTFAGSGTSMFLLYQSNSAATTSTTIDFSMPQSELNSFTTPFVNGTRSGTQAIIDLTGNNTVTVSSLTYASDNTFSFNGTSDVATIPSLNLNNMDYSVEVWFNCSSINRVNGLIGDLQFDWWTFQVQSNNTLRAKHKESDVLGGPTVTGTTTISANIWYQAVMTFSTVSGMKVYLNGVLDGSTSNVQPFTLTGRGPQYIGQHRGGAASSPEVMNGKIGIVKIYKNLCLSASEVKSNFNALRGRFGL